MVKDWFNQAEQLRLESRGLTVERVLDDLRRVIAHCGTQAEAGAALELSAQLISLTLSRKLAIVVTLLDGLYADTTPPALPAAWAEEPHVADRIAAVDAVLAAGLADAVTHAPAVVYDDADDVTEAPPEPPAPSFPDAPLLAVIDRRIEALDAEIAELARILNARKTALVQARHVLTSEGIAG